MLKIPFEELMDIINESKEELVIVEGINDKKALELLGFRNIFYINRLPLYKVVEYLQDKERIVILTDLDAEGRKLYHSLKKEFEDRGIQVNDTLREALFKTDIRQIEGLATYIGNLKNKTL